MSNQSLLMNIFIKLLKHHVFYDDMKKIFNQTTHNYINKRKIH